MLEFKNKILLHIPKCAGTSILTALKLNVWNGDDHYNENYDVRIHYNDIQQTHIPAKDIKINKPKVAFVRNPWDRTVSRYWYCRKRYKIKETFEEFVQQKIMKVDYDWGPPSWRCQSDWLDENTVFYKIEDGIEKVLHNEFGVEIKLPIINGMKINNYKIEDKNIYDLIAEYYDKDIKLFNY
tara:strand:+ start:6247 stop:6792 length:546 start_codon:yes stop_codon:yes gene_type:complete